MVKEQVTDGELLSLLRKVDTPTALAAEYSGQSTAAGRGHDFTCGVGPDYSPQKQRLVPAAVHYEGRGFFL